MTPTDLAPQAQVDVEALYLRHRDAMHGTAHAELGARRAHLAGDVVNDVIRELLRARQIGTLTIKDNWEAYLVASVRNRARRVGEADVTRKSTETSRDDPAASADVELCTVAVRGGTGQVADVEVLRAGIRRLDERKKAIIWLRFWHRASRVEIAGALGITSQAVGQHERQALHQLRKEWTNDDRPI